MNLKDKLIQAYKDGATRGLSFETERAKHIQRWDEMGFPTIKKRGVEIHQSFTYSEKRLSAVGIQK